MPTIPIIESIRVTQSLEKTLFEMINKIIVLCSKIMIFDSEAIVMQSMFLLSYHLHWNTSYDKIHEKERGGKKSL